MVTASKALMTEKAVQIALNAHRGQFDKQGEPYIMHPLRVASRFVHPFEWRERIVAILHDVIKDSPDGLNRIVEAAFPIEIERTVVVITRGKAESYPDYIARVADNNIARRVKISDLEDNLNPLRGTPDNFEHLRNRYQYALDYLRGLLSA